MMHRRQAGALLVLLMLMLWPMASFAACSFSSGNKELVNMSLPSSITINPSWTVGTVIATSAVTTPTPSSSVINCTGNTSIGVYNLVGGQGTSGSTVMPTGIAGVGYQILHPGSSYILPTYPNDSIASGNYTMSVASAVQLVVTGTITAGSTLSANTLGYWRYGSLRVEDFVLTNSVTFAAPTCTVTTPNIAVTLPTVSNTALRTVGATAGATAFTIGLNCPAGSAGQNVAVQFDTATQPTGTTGVIKPSGSATNVGVQLTDNSLNPITFGTPKTAGTTVLGANNFSYYARYYALTTAVGAGTLSATATFTVTYP
ncbi:fimbrial protein [Dyella sp. ASV21]|uniref:fimbrial protein n=1 Tax=Dyella sp. ASV21 TaxID=2795114 RepID=UPI0018ECE0BA|nr:fimbrial protein [Dyella sp. ASV21]